MTVHNHEGQTFFHPTLPEKVSVLPPKLDFQLLFCCKWWKRFYHPWVTPDSAPFTAPAYSQIHPSYLSELSYSTACSAKPGVSSDRTSKTHCFWRGFTANTGRNLSGETLSWASPSNTCLPCSCERWRGPPDRENVTLPHNHPWEGGPSPPSDLLTWDCTPGNPWSVSSKAEEMTCVCVC